MINPKPNVFSLSNWKLVFDIGDIKDWRVPPLFIAKTTADSGVIHSMFLGGLHLAQSEYKNNNPDDTYVVMSSANLHASLNWCHGSWVCVVRVVLQSETYPNRMDRSWWLEANEM